MTKKLVPGSPTFFQEHVPVYLETRGFDGHFLDMSAYGGKGPTTMLLLKTVGRSTGRERLHPLIYDNVASEYVVVASNGGALDHPSWYQNLVTRPTVEFQVADKCFRGTWRVPEGGERAQVWGQLAAYFPPYAEYQTRTDRSIPVVMLTALETIASL